MGFGSGGASGRRGISVDAGNGSGRAVRPAFRPLLAFLAVAAVSAALSAGAAAANPPADDAGALRPGAWEAGVAASFLSAEGTTRGDLGLRAGRFFGAPRGLFAVGAELDYTHVSHLDEFGLEGTIGWSAAGTREGMLPFANVAAGIRRESIGSFHEARYPVGFSAGVRSLFGRRAALRFEYRFRRVLGDPVADFTEHRTVVGLSLFWHNG